MPQISNLRKTLIGACLVGAGPGMWSPAVANPEVATVEPAMLEGIWGEAMVRDNSLAPTTSMFGLTCEDPGGWAEMAVSEQGVFMSIIAEDSTEALFGERPEGYAKEVTVLNMRGLDWVKLVPPKYVDTYFLIRPVPNGGLAYVQIDADADVEGEIAKMYSFDGYLMPCEPA